MTSLLTLEFVVKIVSIRWIARLREANVTSKENCLDCRRHRLWITRPKISRLISDIGLAEGLNLGHISEQFEKKYA